MPRLISSNGTDGCIRKCGGLILAYLVTGFSGVCRVHFALFVISLTARPYKTFKQESRKKEGAAPKQRQRQNSAWNRTQSPN